MHRISFACSRAIAITAVVQSIERELLAALYWLTVLPAAKTPRTLVWKEGTLTLIPPRGDDSGPSCSAEASSVLVSGLWERKVSPSKIRLQCDCQWGPVVDGMLGGACLNLELGSDCRSKGVVNIRDPIDI